MDKEFIPYEQALALKELGFNRRTFAQYDTILNNKWVLTFDLSEEGQYPEGSSACIAPTFSQAFRWFREKHEAYYTIEGSKRHGFAFCIYSENDDIVEEVSLVYPTYEEAELECLKKLIEIVKEK